MMRRGMWISVMIVAVGGTTFLLWPRTPTAPAAGVPLALAQDRSSRVSELRYAVTMRVPSERTAPVRGRLTATFTLSDTAPLSFDFAQPADHLLAVSVGGRPRALTVQNGHIVLPSSWLARGENVVEFEFVAGDEALNRQDEFLYSLFVPARASLAMPCFDQPDIKARWALTLEIPRDWTAVSNGREAGRVAAGDRVSWLFDDTPPLPTYLFAFTAGRFQIETATRNGRALRVFHRETDAGKVARNRDAVFDLHASALGWLETYTGIPYPFVKFDMVLLPAFQFSGMEHPGTVYYNANTLLLDASATQNQLLGRASVIAHEAAHMWFGDFVTMKWFNDVWMKEVFANFMAAKIVNPSFPSVNHDLRFLYQHLPGAYEIDRTEGANPIRQPLANLNEAGSLYGAIIYQKAPVVMRQLELAVGADAFRDGLREYLSAHAFGNADWLDLIRALDPRTEDDLTAWSHAWVEEAGRPTITTDLQIANGVISRLALRLEDPRGRRLEWPQRLQVLVSFPSGVRAFDVRFRSGETTIPDAVGLAAPLWVLPVGGGLGYGFFDLDRATLDYLTTRLDRIADPLTRGAGLVAIWEAMLEGRVAPDVVFRMLMAAIPVETDELNLQQMLDYGRAAFWRFTPADDRADAASRLEPILRAGLGRARSTSARSAWFATLRSVATTPSTVQWLEQVWRRTVAIPGLPLAETDESDLAFELAVRDVAATDDILDTQQTRITNPDRQARFAYIRPALSRNAAVRDRFFESLRTPSARTREAWVLDAVRYLHHPLRAPDSRKHVRPALDLLRDIQQTGDIFFPKRWADATLGGYQSITTAADVRAFIDALPVDYPQRLRWVLLSSADPLFRAARWQQ